jgi:hypothetical protein
MPGFGTPAAVKKSELYHELLACADSIDDLTTGAMVVDKLMTIVVQIQINGLVDDE